MDIKIHNRFDQEKLDEICAVYQSKLKCDG
jgi:hypothetical protein